MSGTLINSRQEEIIHKLQKKKWVQNKQFSPEMRLRHMEKKNTHHQIEREKKKKWANSHHSDSVPSNYK